MTFLGFPPESYSEYDPSYFRQTDATIDVVDQRSDHVSGTHVIDSHAT
jgi:hypothetical protein